MSITSRFSGADRLKAKLDAVGEVHLDDLFVQPGPVVATPAQVSNLDVRWRCLTGRTELL